MGHLVKTSSRLNIFFICFIILQFSVLNVTPAEYGVDVTSPIHHYLDKETSPYFSSFYDSMIQGCYDKFSKRECDATELARMEMNMKQPASQHNYTKIGFKKMRVPKEAWEPLLAFYEQNKNNQHLESWPRGYTYVNTWESPSYMISLEDRSLRGGLVVKQQIWDGVQPIIEEWTGKKITATSMYGIRVYRDKSILATHVDRLPLVSSCIINVAQDTNEPWPIEVYDHDGNAHNVTMEPGDMVLYESHTVLHGRPFPMNGKFFANVFVHFQPIDHEDVQQHDRELKAQQQTTSSKSLFTNPFTKTKIKKIGGHEQDQHDAADIQRHFDKLVADDERDEDRQRPPVKRPKSRTIDNETPNFTDPDVEDMAKQFEFDELHFTKPELLRRVAARGDIVGLTRLLKSGTSSTTIALLQQSDENGWQAVHEAVRSGSLECVKLLVENGADIGSKVEGGGAVLWIAQSVLAAGHEVTRYLEEIGAP